MVWFALSLQTQLLRNLLLITNELLEVALCSHMCYVTNPVSSVELIFSIYLTLCKIDLRHCEIGCFLLIICFLKHMAWYGKYTKECTRTCSTCVCTHACIHTVRDNLSLFWEAHVIFLFPLPSHGN